MKLSRAQGKGRAVKALSMGLVAVMISLYCAACAPKEDSNPQDVSSGSNDGIYDENGYLLDDLGNDLDFGGEEIHFICWADRSMQEFTSDGISSDDVNNAIFDRNTRVSQRLNVQLVYYLTKGNYNNRDSFAQTVENDYLSGMPEYNIYASYGPLGPTFAQRGYSADIKKLDYLNFSKPWWPEKIVSELSIGNKLFFVTGDISTNLLWMMHGTFVNLTMLDNKGIEENPYELVRQGEWTLEKMKSMAANIYEDKDIDGKRSADDVFGYTVHQNVLEAFVIGAGIKAVEKDKNDMPTISATYRSEKMADIVASMGSWLNSSPDVWMEEGYVNPRKIFEEGRALFITDKAYIVASGYGIKEITDKYAFLPMPKYDEEQKDYCTDIGNPHTVYSISNATEDKKNICAAVLECLASESYRRVMPVVFEITMKARYSADPDASEMYDIERRTITFDFGKVFSFIIGKEGCEVYKVAIYKNSGGWSSTFNTIRPKLKSSLDSIIEEFEKNEN
ncbi:MAG: hypothetical protein ACI3XQ_05880 [Eubacteriales bacterium]